MLLNSIDDLSAGERDNKKNLAQYVDLGHIQSSC
jgi:hypothetical protein